LGTGGANVEATNQSGQTALHIACAINHLALVRLLVEEYNADIHALDKDGKTPLDEAERNHTGTVAHSLEFRMEMECHYCSKQPQMETSNATLSVEIKIPTETDFGFTGPTVTPTPNLVNNATWPQFTTHQSKYDCRPNAPWESSFHGSRGNATFGDRSTQDAVMAPPRSCIDRACCNSSVREAIPTVCINSIDLSVAPASQPDTGSRSSS
jgi:Ankyrin repeats (many copies)